MTGNKLEYITQLLEQNKKYCSEAFSQNTALHQNLTKGQHPKVFYIGCADSRVPESLIFNLQPGDMFVHRNVANIIKSDDNNFLSCLQYAVEVLKVDHIVVCGHQSCGGVNASMADKTLETLEHWLVPTKRLYKENEAKLNSLSADDKLKKLVELNVQLSLHTLANIKYVKDAWANGQKLTLHGFVYSLENGQINDLKVQIESSNDVSTKLNLKL